MATHARPEIDIQIDRIFLDLNNPRFEPVEREAEAIAQLCSKEDVAQLARDIVEHGLSPFDRFGVTVDAGTTGRSSAYTVAEGNRRICALKLLIDPDRAPAPRREYFVKLSADWEPIVTVPCVVFQDADDLGLWLDRRHHGPAGGVGIKAWNSEQKTRHKGESARNQLAQAFLDYAENARIITADQRKGRLTTVDRFLKNALLRGVLGISKSGPNHFTRSISDDDFMLLASKFLDDLLDKESDVGSRMNRTDIEAYARQLSALPGQTRESIPPSPLVAPSTPSKSAKIKTPKPLRQTPPNRLPWRDDIAEALTSLGNWKLQSLYQSLCTVQLNGNVSLLSVGVWSFIESLTSAAGRTDNSDFAKFLKSDRIEELGSGSKRHVQTLGQTLRRIQEYGNTAKHHPTAAAFNAEQLYNDMDTLGDTILKVVELAQKQNV